jgi:hypothetical protein
MLLHDLALELRRRVDQDARQMRGDGRLEAHVDVLEHCHRHEHHHDAGGHLEATGVAVQAARGAAAAEHQPV